MRFNPRTPERAFPFYASTLDALEELPEERQGEVALVLLDFAFRDDIAAPFDCSEDDLVVLGHAFFGIIEEGKRFKIGQRFEKMLQRAELTVSTAENPQAKEATEVRNADIIAKLKKLKWTASRDPDKVKEEDIYLVLGPDLYPRVGQPAILWKEMLTEAKKLISMAPEGRKGELEKEFFDLVNFFKSFYLPVTPGNNSSSADSTPKEPEMIRCRYGVLPVTRPHPHGR